MKKTVLSLLVVFFILLLSACIGLHEEALQYAKTKDLPIIITYTELTHPDNANGNHVLIGFINTSKQPIRKIVFKVMPFDKNGKVAFPGKNDELTPDLGCHELFRFGEGNVGHGITPMFGWNDIWHNENIKCFKIIKITIEYLNGSTLYIPKNRIKPLLNKSTKHLSDYCDIH